MMILFIDESGNHGMEKIEAEYPVFVLAGVIMDAEYHRSTLRDRVRAFKLDACGTDDICLRTADIVRARKGFEFLRIEEMRAEFLEKLNALMRDSEYKVVACAIDKIRAKQEYVSMGRDPYYFSLRILIERFVMELQDCGDQGMIVPECRGNVLDGELEAAWNEVKLNGTDYFSAESVIRRIVDFLPLRKKPPIPGLEFADLVASPIGRMIIGNPTHEDWEIVKEKFRRKDNRWDGPGLVVLP